MCQELTVFSIIYGKMSVCWHEKNLSILAELSLTLSILCGQREHSAPSTAEHGHGDAVHHERLVVQNHEIPDLRQTAGGGEKSRTRTRAHTCKTLSI